MKKCLLCGNRKYYSLFHKNKNGQLGLAEYCKMCRSEQETKRYIKNKDEIKAKVIKYQKLNADKVNENHRKWRKLNPEKVKLHTKKWSDKNKELLKVIYAVRNRKRTQAEGDFVKRLLLDKLEYWGYKCWICNGSYTAIDHVKPLSRGGSNWLSNLRPICGSCNSRKHNIWPFRKELLCV
jgi:hypothetical protein